MPTPFLSPTDTILISNSCDILRRLYQNGYKRSILVFFGPKLILLIKMAYFGPVYVVGEAGGVAFLGDDGGESAHIGAGGGYAAEGDYYVFCG